MVDRRWDNDQRGTGVQDGTAFAAPVERLVETLGRPGWIAEDPHAHLLPHLEATAAARGWTLPRWSDEDGVLVVDLDVGGDRAHKTRLEAAYALIGSIAEASTHVREVEPSVYEVLTGMLPGDGAFATHGHVVRIRAVRPDEP
jgi:hypothetical protein